MKRFRTDFDDVFLNSFTTLTTGNGTLVAIDELNNKNSIKKLNEIESIEETPLNLFDVTINDLKKIEKKPYQMKTDGLWIRKYRPSKFIDLITNEMNNRLIAKNLLSKNRKDFILVHGPIGCGKTTALEIICRHCKYEVSILSACDDRTPSSIKVWLMSIGCQSLYNSQIRRCLIIDECDTLSAQTMQILLKYHEKKSSNTKQSQIIPIIFIANNLYSNNLRNIRTKSEIFPFHSIPSERLIDHLKDILTAENVPSTSDIDERLRRLCEEYNHDIRSCINQIQFGALSDIVTSFPDDDEDGENDENENNLHNMKLTDFHLTNIFLYGLFDNYGKITKYSMKLTFDFTNLFSIYSHFFQFLSIDNRSIYLKHLMKLILGFSTKNVYGMEYKEAEQLRQIAQQVKKSHLNLIQSKNNENSFRLSTNYHQFLLNELPIIFNFLSNVKLRPITFNFYTNKEKDLSKFLFRICQILNVNIKSVFQTTTIKSHYKLDPDLSTLILNKNKEIHFNEVFVNELHRQRKKSNETDIRQIDMKKSKRKSKEKSKNFLTQYRKLHKRTRNTNTQIKSANFNLQ
ncbi:hypothetical protein SNEBB_002147 [Seison nebaliae]|nr:hypothetical protein SNEBB_002147 [Seison nebaliae]